MNSNNLWQRRMTAKPLKYQRVLKIVFNFFGKKFLFVASMIFGVYWTT